MFEMMYFIPFCCLLEFQCVDGDHTLSYIFHIHQVMDNPSGDGHLGCFSFGINSDLLLL